MSEWLVDTLIVTTALMLLVLAIRRPVAQAFGAHVAYMLWLIPGARMLMPVLTETVERPAPALDAMPVTSPAAALTMPAGEPLNLAPMASEVPAAPGLIDTQVAALGGGPGLLLLVYLLGAVGFFAGRMLLYRRERRAILDGAQAVAELGGIRLVRSPAVSGPLAFGILDKVIALPENFDDHFTAREQELALDHELSHHRAGDLVANLVAFAMLSVHWFNPVAWAAWRAFRFDQEAACDARVIGTIDSGDRVTYGRAIAKAASGRAALFAAALDNPENLKRRLKTMTFHRHKMLRHAGTAAIAAALVVGLPLTATKAIEYVDAPRAPSAPTAPSAVAAPSAPAAPLAPPAPTVVVPSLSVPVPPTPPLPAWAPKAPTIPAAAAAILTHPHGNVLVIDGKSKKWEELSPEEKAEVRKELREARKEMREAMKELREERKNIRIELKQDLKMDRQEMRRELEEANREIEEARREIDVEILEIERNADRLRADGENPEMIIMSLRAAQDGLAAIDIENIITTSMASIDIDSIERSMAQAERQMEEQIRQLEELERRD